MNPAWEIREVEWPREVCAAVRAFAADDELAWLDTAALAVAGGFSLVAASPCAVLNQNVEGAATFATSDRVLDSDASGWSLWERVHKDFELSIAAPFPVGAGWIGSIGFEMARGLERLPATRRDPLGMPLLHVGLYDAAVVLDHAARRAWMICVESIAERLGRAARPLQYWVERWTAAQIEMSESMGLTADVLVEADQDRPEYEARIRRALDYIAAGDIYQVNLAQRFVLDGLGDPLSHYADLRRANPAAYAALLRWDDFAVASLSPELFLERRGRDVLTRPIKGTRPHTHDAVLDAVHRRDLLDSEKDAAELAMIVDLHRNDLGRVCEYGSVRVPHARRLETHPTVYHTVADVSGRLRRNRTSLDLLRACFPAGSITGAPKIRAIEIIDELEPVARGVYTGAVGHLSLDGSMTFNVAIRTLQIHAGTATLYAGGGIVADSDPSAEYEETLAKARGVFAGLGIAGHQPRPAGHGGVRA